MGGGGFEGRLPQNRVMVLLLLCSSAVTHFHKIVTVKSKSCG